MVFCYSIMNGLRHCIRIVGLCLDLIFGSIFNENGCNWPIFELFSSPNQIISVLLPLPPRLDSPTPQLAILWLFCQSCSRLESFLVRNYLLDKSFVNSKTTSVRQMEKNTYFLFATTNWPPNESHKWSLLYISKEQNLKFK